MHESDKTTFECASQTRERLNSRVRQENVYLSTPVSVMEAFMRRKLRSFENYNKASVKFFSERLEKSNCLRRVKALEIVRTEIDF